MARVPVTLDNTLGALLVGFALSCALFGIVMAQVFSYFKRYTQDKLVYKVLVTLIGILELVDQIFIGHVVYFFLVTNFLKPNALVTGRSLSLILQQIAGAIVGSLVTFCYTLRVWRFSNRNYWISAILAGVSLGHLSTSIVFTVQAFELPTVPAVANLTTTGTIALGLGAAADILTAAALCFFLRKLRTGYRGSDKLVGSLMRYAISTGVVTSMISIAVLILFNIMPHNLIFISVYFVLSKSYAISFMATMNTRRCIRGRGTDNNGSTELTHSASRSTNLQLNSRVPDPNGGFWQSETDLFYKNPIQGSVHPESSREFVHLQYLPTTKEPRSTTTDIIDDYYFQQQVV